MRFVSSSLSLQPQPQVLQYVGVGASSRGRRELVQLLKDAVVCRLDHQLQTAVQFSKNNEIERCTCTMVRVLSSPCSGGSTGRKQ